MPDPNLHDPDGDWTSADLATCPRCGKDRMLPEVPGLGGGLFCLNCKELIEEGVEPLDPA
jgi:hypothetical protein